MRVFRVRWLALMLAVALGFIACSDSGGNGGTESGSLRVSRADFGEEWPLTVESGLLRCEGVAAAGAVSFTANGTTYAVNGFAMQKGLPDIDPIWADAPGGLKKNIGPLISRGLALCKE